MIILSNDGVILDRDDAEYRSSERSMVTVRQTVTTCLEAVETVIASGLVL